ncbi:MAG: uncharacterized protein PWP09_1912 [Thermotogota bacterium]|nr:uncharacterized protein [Thermotogota bacterium]
MYFDPHPKTSKEDFFDRERELEELGSANMPLIMVLGTRRIGKTSLIRVFFNETHTPHLFIDCRRFSSTSAKIEDFVNILSSSLEKLSRRHKRLLKMLSKVRGVNVFGVEMEIDSKNAKTSLIDLFHELDEWSAEEGKHTYLVFDEAQNLRFYRRAHGISFNEVFGYIYDNLRNLRIVLTGSEVGLLEEFVGIEDPVSPLYGRYIKEIYLKPFARETSMEFLRLGFKQAGMKVKESLLEIAVDVLDGITGWLVYFGKTCLDLKKVDETAITSTLKVASTMVESELQMLSKWSERYIHILKVIAMGASGWSEIKEGVEFLEKQEITDASITRLLERLEKMGFIEKLTTREGRILYRIVDPVVPHVVRGR